MADRDPFVDVLDRALDDVGPIDVDGLAERLQARRMRHRRRRRTSRMVPLGAVAALIVLLVVVVVRNQPAAQVSTDDGTEADDGLRTFGFEPGWHELDPGPLGSAPVGTAAWTGRELVFLFTSDPDPVPQPDGLAGSAYDPAARTWRRIAPMPLPAGTLESVWAGTELIVIRTATGSTQRLPDAAAAWDPVSDTWRTLPAPPPVVANGFAGAFWSGSEAIFPSRLSRFDVARSAWSALPPLPPDSSGRFIGGWTGSELVMVRISGPGETLAWEPGNDAWVLRAPPPSFLATGATASKGRLILARAASEGSGGAAYDAAGDGWTLLPPIDRPVQRCSTSVVQLGSTAAVQWCSTVAVLASGRWIDVGLPIVDAPNGAGPGLPGVYLGILVGAGDVLFGYQERARPDGTSLDLFVPAPGQVPGSSTEPDPQAPAGDRASTPAAWPIVRIGGATLDVPNGFTVNAERNGDQVTVGVPIEPGWPPEPPCTITSRRSSDDPSSSLGALRGLSSQPHVDRVSTQFGNPAGAFLAAGDVDAHEHVIVAASTEEVIDIACGRLLLARELAQYVR
jgi:hypothetical protein